MKAILTIIIIIMSATLCKAQTTTYRLNELEKWRTQAKSEIIWLKAGKKTDSLKIVQLTLSNKVLQDSLKKFKPLLFIGARVGNGLKIDTVYINHN